MTPGDYDAMVEALTNAHRETGAGGEIVFHPYFFDLDDRGRLAAAERAITQRALEAAFDEEGLTTTARAVLHRISKAG